MFKHEDKVVYRLWHLPSSVNRLGIIVKHKINSIFVRYSNVLTPIEDEETKEIHWCFDYEFQVIKEKKSKLPEWF